MSDIEKNNKYVCNICTKDFCSKMTLIRHQKTAKSCLQLQEKDGTIECENCKKTLAIQSYKKHLVKCNIIFEKSTKELEKIKKQNKKLTETSETVKAEINKLKNDLTEVDKLKEKIEEYKNLIFTLEKQNETLKANVIFLEKQNEKLHTASTNITMKLAEKTNTVNNTTNNIIVNNNPITNDVLRQCATTFNLDNAYSINGITKHLTSSLEDHITCTDPSRNIFKYTNEKDEEIVDQNLEILIPQYLTAVKDRNNFLYKEVFEYFKKNNVSLSVQTDYRVFYNALNSIIEKTGQQDKYTEKCKQQMVRECKRRFLEKNKNKEKTITKNLTMEEVMMNVIETGGTVYEFIERFLGYDGAEDEETDEQFTQRRNLEDVFREKKREWKKNNENNEKE